MTQELVERERRILDLLSARGFLSVSALAQELEVSEVTARSDLRSLEERGIVSRSRGGVFPAFHRDILDKQRFHMEEKNRIARAAAEMVREGDCVMIEAGTTTALLVKHLVGKRDIQVVTNSTLVFAYARSNPALRIIMTGGAFHRATESLVGPVAIQSIRDFNVRLAFVGTDGFSVERGMTTQFAEGAEIVRAMRGQAQATWLLADSSKYGKTGFVSVLALADIEGLISDTGLNDEARLSLSKIPIRLARV